MKTILMISDQSPEAAHAGRFALELARAARADLLLAYTVPATPIRKTQLVPAGNLDEPDELAYWTDALEVDEATLRGAIQAVGFGAGDVRDYLKWRQAATAAS